MPNPIETLEDSLFGLSVQLERERRERLAAIDCLSAYGLLVPREGWERGSSMLSSACLLSEFREYNADHQKALPCQNVSSSPASLSSKVPD
jgi:hypothetical protein